MSRFVARMMELVRRHWLKAMGLLLMGAVGSALWQIVARPVLMGLSGLLMTIGTLGIPSLRDDIYVDVAKGFHEDPSITLVAMAIGVLGVTLFFLVRSALTAQAGDHDFELDSSPQPAGWAERIWRRRNSSSKLLGGMWEKAVTVNVVLLVVCVVLLCRLFYVNQAIVYFRQCFDAASPYISDQEEEEILGQFSSMQSRADFIAITGRLERPVRAHGKRWPEFTIW